jgi:hypothetical protein
MPSIITAPAANASRSNRPYKLSGRAAAVLSGWGTALSGMDGKRPLRRNHGPRQGGRGERKEEPSFLKKRSKKLLFVLASAILAEGSGGIQRSNVFLLPLH